MVFAPSVQRNRITSIAWPHLRQTRTLLPAQERLDLPIRTLSGSRGTGETHCLPHHLTIKDGKERLMIAALRYYDIFVKTEGAWLFPERKLYVDWTEERALS
jgi:hypothetical protein